MERSETRTCIHGDWEGNVCKCHPGYVTDFNAIAVNAQYCESNAKDIVEERASYDSGHYYHLLGVSLTVALFAAASLVLLVAVVTVMDKFRTRERINRAKRKLIEFEAARLKRDGGNEMLATTWTPSKRFKCIRELETSVKVVTRRARALAVYKPEGKKELELKPGLEISDVTEVGNGWCKGKVNDKSGFFPSTFVEMLD